MGGAGGRSPPSRRARRPVRAAAAGGGSFMGRSPLLDIWTLFRHMVTKYVPHYKTYLLRETQEFLQNIPISMWRCRYRFKHFSRLWPQRLGGMRNLHQPGT